MFTVVGPKRYERWGVAPTREEGTLHTTDVGEPNPPTGAASSKTITPGQLNHMLSAVKRINDEGFQEQAIELMGSFISTVNNEVSPIMTLLLHLEVNSDSRRRASSLSLSLKLE